MFDALELRLGVAIPDDLLLKGNNIKPANAPIDVGDMNAYVGGAMSIEKAPGGTLRLTGEVNTVRGNYTFQGRRFEILRDGRIRFQGSDVIDPLLDLDRAARDPGRRDVRPRARARCCSRNCRSAAIRRRTNRTSCRSSSSACRSTSWVKGSRSRWRVRAQELAGGYLASGLSRGDRRSAQPRRVRDPGGRARTDLARASPSVSR